MHPTLRAALGGALALATLASLTACGGADGGDTAPVLPDTAEVVDAPAGTAAPIGSTSPLPTGNAAQTRNDLLALAATADFTAGNPDTAMVTSWLGTYPELERTLLDDQPADESTVSVSPAFLLTPLVSDTDQAWGFAVLDTSGTCAGGVVVITGGGDPTLPPATFPSQFAPVDGFSPCTAEAAVAALAASA